ncbi:MULTISPECIES: hypothetical protein [unclassified Burkholderia]|uniref:hypothetical protein n=1 Tax=Burkholderia sp. AU45388 TaxID=3059206 RepID=UPI00211B6582|nr:MULTISPECIES: hypothetical protein [unclassified Burkholderia]MDN7425190.1 hypothetical protein [Burkholderia sp. AU45388]
MIASPSVRGFTLDDIRGFLDCMLLIEGTRSCDQIADLEKRRDTHRIASRQSSKVP